VVGALRFFVNFVFVHVACVPPFPSPMYTHVSSSLSAVKVPVFPRLLALAASKLAFGLVPLRCLLAFRRVPRAARRTPKHIYIYICKIHIYIYIYV
jgi:hypothetical protein